MYTRWASQAVLEVKNPPVNTGDSRDKRFDPWVGKIPWRRKWQPLVFLPGEAHGQRSRAGYSPQHCKELDMTEATSYAHIQDNGVCFVLQMKTESISILE